MQALSQCLLVSMGDIETTTDFAPVVKLVITPPCHGGGQGFESPPVRQVL